MLDIRNALASIKAQFYSHLYFLYFLNIGNTAASYYFIYFHRNSKQFFFYNLVKYKNQIKVKESKEIEVNLLQVAFRPLLVLHLKLKTQKKQCLLLL